MATDTGLLGKEGAYIWQKHFPPKKYSKEIIEVPYERIKFLSVTLLSLEKFDWAKKFIISNVWNIITQISDR